MDFVCAWSEYDSPKNNGKEGDAACVDEHVACGWEGGSAIGPEGERKGGLTDRYTLD